MVQTLVPRLKVSLPGRAPTPASNPAGPPKGQALAINMAPEAHKRRMQGLYNGWHIKSQLRKGEKVVLKHAGTNKSRKRKRLRLQETVAKEAREIQEIARKNAAAAMRRMAQIAQTSHNETAAIAATMLIMDRAYGKATQTNINANLDANGKTTDISQKELDTRIDTALKRIDSLTRGAPKAPKSKAPPIDLRKLDRDPDSTPLN
jgi:hypothetical protein